MEVSRFNALNKSNEDRIEKYKLRGFGTALMNRDLLLDDSKFLDNSENSSDQEESVVTLPAQHHNIKSLAKSFFVNHPGASTTTTQKGLCTFS